MSGSSSKLAEVRTTVDVVIFTHEDNQLKVLLVKREADPFAGRLALPGGFLWENETFYDAARRILGSKAGVKDVFMEQLYTFDEPDRDPRARIVTVTYYALIPRDRLKLASGDSLQSPELYSVNEVSGLAFDHDKILTYAVARMRSKFGYTNAAYSLLPDRFTFSELQSLYEVILGRALDKRNFRKKYLSLGLIEPTAERVSGRRHRPAQLYKFVDARPTELPEPAF
jgi:ADP-ribose pyrophosphatase YjhB (NUDIX family)